MTGYPVTPAPPGPPPRPWYLEFTLWLLHERGMVVESCSIRRSGSCYLVVTRPWVKGDIGLKLRLSDHLPPSGRVPGWVHFWPTLASLRDLGRYLDVKARRGGGVGDLPPVEASSLPREGREGRQVTGASQQITSGPRALRPGGGDSPSTKRDS